jgi:hypothetical protein
MVRETQIWHRWWETRNALIVPNSIPVDQPLGRDHITTGGLAD